MGLFDILKEYLQSKSQRGGGFIENKIEKDIKSRRGDGFMTHD